MAKLYYGNGCCTIEGTNIVKVVINYRGAIRIIDKTPDNYFTIANNKRIIIFALEDGQLLNELFEYTGYFKVKSANAIDINGERIYTTIKPVMDFSELLGVSETLTEITSENMNAGYLYKGRRQKTTVDKDVALNQQPEDGLYLRDGSVYTGTYHIHATGRAMTGGEHTQGSRVLYMMKNNKLVQTGASIKKTKISAKRVTPSRTMTSVASGGAGGGGGY